MKGKVAFIPAAHTIEFHDYELPEPPPGGLLTRVTHVQDDGRVAVLAHSGTEFAKKWQQKLQTNQGTTFARANRATVGFTAEEHLEPRSSGTIEAPRALKGRGERGRLLRP